MELSDVLNGKGGLRAQAGHTVHQMRTMAQVPCDCAACRKAATQPAKVEAGDNGDPF